MWRAGDQIGSYRIVERLRSGGMATLFLGRRLGVAGFARPVAIKVVHPHLAKDRTFVRMFIDEAKLSAAIDHPNVVHVDELGQSGTTYFLAMEYVQGVSLHQLQRSLARMRRRLSPEMAVWIAMQVAEGLHAAHETRGEDDEPLGVVHRDVSPQNVLLSYRGGVKLIDFGIAKARGRSQDTAAGSLKGKLRYMAPEQAYGREVDRRADVYALGVVLWEMLTERRLFHADSDLALIDLVRNPDVKPPGEFAEGIAPALDRVVLAALAPSTAARIATARELRERLAAAMPGALVLGPTELADLLAAAMGETIEREKRRGSAGGDDASDASIASLPTPATGAGAGDEDALTTLTCTDDGVELDEDDISDVYDDEALAALAGPPSLAPRASRTPAPARRLGPVALGVASLLAVATLGVSALLIHYRASPAPAAARVLSVPRPVTMARPQPVVAVTPAASDVATVDAATMALAATPVTLPRVVRHGVAPRLVHHSPVPIEDTPRF